MTERKEGLTEYYQAIHSTIKDLIPELPDGSIKLFDETVEDLSFSGPTILVEFCEAKLPQKSSSNKHIELKVKLHCVLSSANDDLPLACANMAAYVMTIAERNAWGLEAVSHPTNLSALPGRYGVGENGFDSWIVEFDQTLKIADSWSPVNFVPNEVLWGIAPEVGLGHEDKYKPAE